MKNHCFNRTFKNMIKTTDMDSVKGTFTKYEGITTSSETEPINSIGHYTWAPPESADYIVPYYMDHSAKVGGYNKKCHLLKNYKTGFKN